MCTQHGRRGRRNAAERVVERIGRRDVEGELCGLREIERPRQAGSGGRLGVGHGVRNSAIATEGISAGVNVDGLQRGVKVEWDARLGGVPEAQGEPPTGVLGIRELVHE